MAAKVKIKLVTLETKPYRKRKCQLINREEMKAAKLELYRLAQMESFPVEYDSLQTGKQLPNRNKITPLRPVMDDGLIRVGGRIGLAHISRDSKHQIILSPKHHISTLIVIHIHETNFHVGRNSTLAFTRENFWITSGKSFIRYTINRCNFCKRHRVQSMAPLMGELPFERIAYMETPLIRNGVDYFGPLLIKRGKRTRSNCGTAKRYGALFTCLTTRAVHVELAGDLSTDSFILALRRFISRRGHPKTIISDNGSNFVGAEREISRMFESLRPRKDL